MWLNGVLVHQKRICCAGADGDWHALAALCMQGCRYCGIIHVINPFSKTHSRSN
jgi:hypothetical protein